MDQLISAIGEKDHAVLIDCRDLSSEAVPLPAGASVVVMDTGTRRGLLDTGYNERRRQCERAAEFFGARALRDVSLTDFTLRAAGLDDVVRRRARHVMTENDRTQRAAKAMKTDNAVELGQLLNQSHASMRDDFAISNLQLDCMVEIARQSAGCLGARLTDGGFGGCAIALVDDAEVSSFLASVSRDYEDKTSLTPALYLCRAANGAECISR